MSESRYTTQISESEPMAGVVRMEDGRFFIQTLDIWMNDKKVGSLSMGRDAQSPTGIVFVLRYTNDATPEDEISMALPVNVNGRRHMAPELFAIFEQLLPEMKLERFPAWRHSNVNLDFNMAKLAAAGNRNLAHFRFATKGEAPRVAVPVTIKRTDIEQDEIPGEDLFTILVNRCAHIPGIAGVQPKMLVEMVDTLPHDASARTLKTDTHILKIASKPSLRGITLMEHHALQAAARAGIPVPDTFVSPDGMLIAVERFDLLRGKDDEITKKLAIEEVCGLLGRNRTSKYDAPAEIVAALLQNLKGPKGQKAQNTKNLELFFQYMAFNYVIENGDGHLKNFALLREGHGSVAKLAPLYDVSTSAPFTCEIPGGQDQPAMTLGNTCRWGTWRELVVFGVRHCGLSPEAAIDHLERIAEAVRSHLPALKAEALSHHDIQMTVIRTASIWNRSTESALRWVANNRKALKPTEPAVGVNHEATPG